VNYDIGSKAMIKLHGRQIPIELSDRGYVMLVACDYGGTYTEKRNTAALKRMERFADVVDSKEIIEIWGKNK
jgi:hypothetical protein